MAAAGAVVARPSVVGSSGTQSVCKERPVESDHDVWKERPVESALPCVKSSCAKHRSQRRNEAWRSLAKGALRLHSQPWRRLTDPSVGDGSV